ncbi:hypothetical protein LOY18_12045 [Staphylococcus capitis]|uniref:hypothetical protein n=2 Tax=Staphylococcus capitis TaxID=29388 RepID=UPI001E5EA2AC|nr:hypothetical protein [Staphylococcus capitis]MCC9117513.1 hypothetical protein [Staphylococcus capitis]MCC9143961.1 hypothetical protein [Staphylococcus capitis]
MALNDLITTKNASQFLNISPSSLRAYAQTMELLGYEFKRRENARQFSQYDLHIINEAMKFFKLHGGTMKTALHYAIVKEEHGEDIANALPELQEDYVEEDNTPQQFDLSAFSDDIVSRISEQINAQIKEQSQNTTENVIQALYKHDKPTEDVEYLKRENERLQASVSQIQKDKDEYICKYKELESENKHLRSEIEKLKSMSMWEFRKWKKE